MSLFDCLEDALPNDHCKQTNSSNIVINLIEKGFAPKKTLDIGSKEDAFKLFDTLPSATKCIAMAITSSGVEVHEASETQIYPYNNGTVLPFKSEYFDLVYSHHALEHIPKPHKTLSEIARVLTKDGLFIGQTSQFEPYHSFNLWNFTVYGFKKIIEKAGMQLMELRPGIDGLTLMERSYTGDFAKYNKYFSVESPINTEIEQRAQQVKFSNRMINYKKLMYCGHFCFVCKLK